MIEFIKYVYGEQVIIIIIMIIIIIIATTKFTNISPYLLLESI
jgi:hypothetical protein